MKRSCLASCCLGFMAWTSLATIITACNSSISSQQTNTSPIPSAEIENNSFVEAPLGFEITSTQLFHHLSPNLKTNRTSKQNVHVPELRDTLLTVETSGKIKNWFLFHQTNQKEFFKAAVIRTPAIKMKHDIEVGMSYEAFTAALGIKITSDKVKIVDTEHSHNWTFCFSNQLLDSICYSAYLD